MVVLTSDGAQHTYNIHEPQVASNMQDHDPILRIGTSQFDDQKE